ncbi:MAG: NAD(+) synthase [Synergistaceae bacterium]|jgi:NAD+ synthase|nr:NAD(+) synthase [Synergistaceae bacterium]
MPILYRDPSILLASIENWLAEQLRSAGDKGGIVGLSGGIDSAVVAAILKRVCGNRMLAVIMPCHSHPEDRLHAAMVAAHLQIPHLTVDLTETYDALISALGEGEGSRMAQANLKPRLRMSTLYFLAQTRNMLVCGTGNKVELTVGYFTKYGDSGVDLLPLGDLLKGEVRQLAGLLEVPAPIIDKPPSAGLWEGQTDEGEMGVTYDELDRFLALGEGSDKVRNFVEQSRARSEHKRRTPPICRISETKQA